MLNGVWNAQFPGQRGQTVVRELRMENAGDVKNVVRCIGEGQPLGAKEFQIKADVLPQNRVAANKGPQSVSHL